MDPDAAKDLYFALWAFLIYGFYGVIVEMTFCYAKQYKGVIESRCGLLYLPLSPIYGLGGVAVSVFLLPYVDDRSPCSSSAWPSAPSSSTSPAS